MHADDSDDHFGYWLLAIGYWLLAIGYWLLAWLLAILSKGLEVATYQVTFKFLANLEYNLEVFTEAAFANSHPPTANITQK
jgi:hypothetical protein